MRLVGRALPTNPNNTLILQVMVTRWRARRADIEDTEAAASRRSTRHLREDPKGKLMRRHTDEHGFSLIEMTVIGLMLVVTGSIFALLNPGQGNFVAEPEIADMQQRTRRCRHALQRPGHGLRPIRRRQPDGAEFSLRRLCRFARGASRTTRRARSALMRSR
jgi:hypothetical protein